MFGQNKKRFLALFVLVVTTAFCYGQYNVDYTTTSDIPSVFMIGEYQDRYSSLEQNYKTTLLDLKNEDLSLAYSEWVSVLDAMQSFAQTIDFKLDGVKLWMHIYWKADGHIDHIAYFPKPQSRTVNEESMQAFLKLFIDQYADLDPSTENYNHYGSASFPLAIR